jgi:hypothetical protein
MYQRRFWPFSGQREGYRPLQGGPLFAEHTSLSRYIRRAFTRQYRRGLVVLVVVIVLLTAVILLARQVSLSTNLASNVVSGLFLSTLALLILVLFAGYLPRRWRS